jgi:arginyl-tRNA synthetase
MEEDTPTNKNADKEEIITKLAELISASLKQVADSLSIGIEQLTMGESQSSIIQVKPTAKAQQKFGDLYCNIGPRLLGLQKKHKVNIIKLSQVEISKLIVQHLKLPASVSKVEVASNGLINFTLQDVQKENTPVKKPKLETSTNTSPAHKLTVTHQSFVVTNT